VNESIEETNRVGVRRLILTPTLALLVFAAVAQATDPAPTPVVLPPDLVALERSLSGLHVNSVAFTGKLSVVVSFEPGLRRQVLTTVVGDLSVSPPRAKSTRRAFGTVTRELTIGRTTYTYVPAFAKFDGGRPWVSQSFGGARREPSTGPTANSIQQQFAGLMKLINGARSITEVGAQNVDGQAVTEFTATVDAKAAASAELGQFGDIKQAGSASAELQLAFASDGLPVRSHIQASTDGVETTFQEDIDAINVPVVVRRPPARLTISQARLDAFALKQSKRAHANSKH
jgi:hypothetical protein